MCSIDRNSYVFFPGKNQFNSLNTAFSPDDLAQVAARAPWRNCDFWWFYGVCLRTLKKWLGILRNFDELDFIQIWFC
jgi:hypothetical protein